MDFAGGSDATPEERFEMRQRRNCGFQWSLEHVRATAHEPRHPELSIRLTAAEAKRLRDHELLGAVVGRIEDQEVRGAPQVYAGAWRSEISDAPSIIVGLVGMDPMRIEAVRQVAGDAPVRFEPAVVSSDALAAAQRRMTEDLSRWHETGILIHSSSVDLKHNRLTLGVAEMPDPEAQRVIASHYAPVPILIITTEAPRLAGGG
jgi:hypothetical protein